MNSNFAVYLIGYILVIAGVGYGMYAAGLSPQWILVVVLIMAGLGIVYAFSRSQRDEATKAKGTDAASTGEGPPDSASASRPPEGGPDAGRPQT